MARYWWTSFQPHEYGPVLRALGSFGYQPEDPLWLIELLAQVGVVYAVFERFERTCLTWVYYCGSLSVAQGAAGTGVAHCFKFY